MPGSPDAILKRTGLRRTPVRVAVLGVLATAERPLDAAEVIDRLPSDIDRVTVYRTLNTFVRKAIVHRVRGEDRSWRYATAADVGSPARVRHRHPHFVCDDCGNVECLGAARIPKSFIQALRVDGAYRVDYPEVVLHGSCPKCHAQ